MPNGHDLAGRYMDFVERTSNRMSLLEADNRNNKMSIRTNAHNIQKNTDGVVKSNENLLTFKAWVERNLGKVVWRTVGYVTAIMLLLSGALALFTEAL